MAAGRDERSCDRGGALLARTPGERSSPAPPREPSWLDVATRRLPETGREHFRLVEAALPAPRRRERNRDEDAVGDSRGEPGGGFSGESKHHRADPPILSGSENFEEESIDRERRDQPGNLGVVDCAQTIPTVLAEARSRASDSRAATRTFGGPNEGKGRVAVRAELAPEPRENHVQNLPGIRENTPPGEIVEGRRCGLNSKSESFGAAEAFVLGAILLATLAIVADAFRPPMYDASSHLATGVIAQRIFAGDDFTSAHYVIDPVPVPYWLTTIGVLSLAGLDPHVAFKILVGVHALLVPLAFVLLARRVAPAATLFTGLVALTVFGKGYWSGETNFVFGQSFVVFALVAYFAARRFLSLATLAFALCAFAVYFAHVFVLCALLGSILVFAALSFVMPRLGRRDEAPPFGPPQAFMLALTLALFAAAVYFVFLYHGTSANRGVPLFDLNPRRLGNLFEDPLTSPTIPGPLPALTFLFILAGLWSSSLPNDPGLSPIARVLAGVRLPFLIAGLAFAALYYFGPVGLLEEGGRAEEDISPRFGWIAFLFLLLAPKLRLGPRRRGLLLVATLAFAAFKLADARALHRRVGAEYETFTTQILGKIPEGSRVLPVNDNHTANSRSWTYFFLYAGNYVAIDRHGYVPTVFARAGQQFLRHATRGEHRAIFDRKIETQEWDWYDYVLVQTNAERPKIDGLAERAREIAAAAGFRLYRIERPVSWWDVEADETGPDPG